MKKLPLHKTKIVCTVGPASRSPQMIEKMILAGMNVARLNFSHADFTEHRENIQNIFKASAKTGRPVSFIADLPGVKIRIGNLKSEPMVIKKGDSLAFTTKNILGTPERVSVSYKQLPQSVSRGSVIYLNDGFIQLRVDSISGTEVHCKVLVGGALRSHKGLNLPGAKLSVNPVTPEDLKIIDFALKEGVDTFGLSFIQRAADIRRVRDYARKKGRNVYLVAKIERKEAVENFEEILREADGIMIARGDLGIEVPIEEVPGIQKRLIRKANLAGRPVITATQMLGSMTQNIRPTRAEVTDVANAIIDGTDAVMLSEETAIGDYPIETIQTMVRIAQVNESMYSSGSLFEEFRLPSNDLLITDAISLNVVGISKRLKARFIVTQTSSGGTARQIARFKPDCWILSFAPDEHVRRFLRFSYGVYPLESIRDKPKPPEILLKTLKEMRHVNKGDKVVITERRLSERSGETDSLSIATVT